MSSRELDAAGITEPALRASYTRCRELLAHHAHTYYLATLLLPKAKRPYIQALYGFARYVDEMADRTDVHTAHRAEALLSWSDQFLTDLCAGHSDDPITRALLHTIHTWNIPHEHFDAFLAAMHADLTVTDYDSYPDLERYMYGAAAVIGLEMVPVLEPRTDAAHDPMRSMGLAFQLTNILRDIAEDLDRGRLYIPKTDLQQFGLTREDLQRRQTTPAIRDLLRFEIYRARQYYRHAHTAVPLLHPDSRDCVRVSLILYAEILDAVEAADYDIFTRRARVGTRRRLQVAIPALARSWYRTRMAARPSTRGIDHQRAANAG